jgi:hypothetical protein
MPKMDPDIEINKRIQLLIDQRQQHADALANINQTLSAVAAALGEDRPVSAMPCQLLLRAKAGVVVAATPRPAKSRSWASSRATRSLPPVKSRLTGQARAGLGPRTTC